MGTAVVIIFDDFEVFGLGPEVNAVFLADHKGPLDGFGVIIEGLLGVAVMAIEHMDGFIADTSSGAVVDDFTFAEAAGRFDIHEKTSRVFSLSYMF